MRRVRVCTHVHVWVPFGLTAGHCAQIQAASAQIINTQCLSSAVHNKL